MLRSLADALPNELIRSLTHEDAAAIYLPLVSVHRVISGRLDDIETQSPLLSKTLLRWPIRSMRSSLERLSDVTEALAWSADPNLRSTLERSIGQIEQQEFHLT